MQWRIQDFPDGRDANSKGAKSAHYVGISPQKLHEIEKNELGMGSANEMSHVSSIVTRKKFNFAQENLI